MARSVSEWIGKTDDHRAPGKVRQRRREKETHPRRAAGAPITLDWLFDRTMPEPNGGCWIWMAAVDHRNGYGALKVGSTVRRAHRISYETATGEKVPAAIDVCHRCDVRCCINPSHLFLGSRLDNMQDCIQKDRFRHLPTLSGEASPNSRLTDDQVRAIRNDHRSQRVIARDYGVDKGTIACIKHRKTWRHL